MPLTLPDLDDRSFADLVAEARALIPALAPDWTDHNPADPGITLIELFAWLTEMLLYRVNQVTDANRLAFLRLINGPDPDWKPDPKTIAAEIRKTVIKLRTPARAVTAADFERLALEVRGVARAHCLSRHNLELGTRADRASDMPGEVSVILVPPKGDSAAPLKDVGKKLDEARLLTTRLHVVTARPVPIGFDLTVRDRAHEDGVDWRHDPPPPHAAIMLTFTIHARPDMHGGLLLKAAECELGRFLDPREGGPDGRGWPFGRAVYLSEIYDCLARLPGADYVTPTEGKPELAADPIEAWRLSANARGEIEALALDPDELPAAEISAGPITARDSEDPARRRL